MQKTIFSGSLMLLCFLLLTCAPVTETQNPLFFAGGKEVEKELINLSQHNPILGEELRRLPELKRGLNEKGVLALNRIVTFYTRSPNPDEIKQTFDKILSVGKKEQRKFSAPLQALFWLAEGKELSLSENLLMRYSRERYWGFNRNLGEDQEVITFVYNIWKDTYDTDKWNDPNEIIERLNSPHLFDLFFRDNIEYDFDKFDKTVSERRYYENWGTYLQSAKLTIKRRRGTCQDAANLANAILTKAGYNIKPLQVKFTSPGFTGTNRHWVAVLDEGGFFYKIADDAYVKEGIVGPFKLISEIGVLVAKNHKTYMKEYSLSQVPMQ